MWIIRSILLLIMLKMTTIRTVGKRGKWVGK